jgi:hypothetical protein
MKKYLFGMFLLCFFVWAVVVDNLVIPSEAHLRQDVGQYTRYRVKNWQKGSKLDVIENELMIYAIVKNREQLYYMDYKNYFENTLKKLPEGAPVQMRYVRRFPKFWKRQLYEIRQQGIPFIRYSTTVLNQKQKDIWKFSGIMAGVYLVLAAIGWVGRPRRK